MRRSAVGTVLVLLAPLACAPRSDPNAASTATLASPDEPGRPMVITGIVSDAQGAPVAGALVHAYHADSSGLYVRERNERPRLEGRLRSGPGGEYRIISVLPGSAEGPAHVHFEVTAHGHPRQLVTMNVPPPGAANVRESSAGTSGASRWSSWNSRPDAAMLRRRGADSTFEVPDLMAPPTTATRRDSGGVALLKFDVRLR